MGLLKPYEAPTYTTPVAKEVPAPAIVYEPEPEPIVQARIRDLIPERDQQGLIKTVTGYNKAGERVEFEFERDGKKNLERIKVR